MKLIGMLSAVMLMVILVLCLCLWSAQRQEEQATGTAPPTAPAAAPLRLGIVPERDIFEQAARLKPFAEYLGRHLGRPVEVVSARSYDAVLEDFATGRTDMAMLGSLVAALAMDRTGAQVVAKPVYDGVATYRGVIFVREDSPITSEDQLAGRSLAMVPATTAGGLFARWTIATHRLLEGPQPVRPVWVGTHDDVLAQVMDGRADAGAIKDTRLELLLRNNPAWRVRRLATSEAVPSNGLLLHPRHRELVPALTELLLAMDKEPQGRAVLEAMGATAFVPCRPEEYGPIFDMVDALGEGWRDVGVAGPPPSRRNLLGAAGAGPN